ncbi:fimbrial protein [Lelliottia sp. V106_10]|uniref:fimbrial protein n=1 Tax=Lelliottia wanjuensis TaxID=3050585 RepID=UPI0025501F1E|nr:MULTISPECIES: fimbrial protein [unclassified Lelliottia]MDK9357759.1 fimbrial protein [Lelliottia sp. V106_16]MDK9372749.1 fimbrial protein [Lelliottia sp. V106_10]MDK9599553.1 fimbrial protein [Lelliottia sp. V106_5]
MSIISLLLNSYSKFNMYNRLLKFFTGLIFIVNVTSAFASCKSDFRPVANISTGTIIAQRDAPVGTVLATIVTPDDPDKMMECDLDGGHFNYTMDYNGGQKTSMEHFYATNIPGVAISLRSYSSGYDWYFESPTMVRDGFPGAYLTHYQTLTVVKTGNITSGSFTGGLIAHMSGDDGVTTLTVNMTGGNVSEVACSITTPKLTFPLGALPASEFGSTIGFTPSETNTQNLGLNCDAGANINVQLNGTQNPDISLNSVLALSGQGSAGTASGLGVQLLYNGTPLEINKNIVMAQSEGGQEMLPITARYYQTKTTVMPGDASASATLTLTYQ